METATTQLIVPPPTTLGGVSVRNTKDLIGPNLRLCSLIIAPPKKGKTTFAATIDALCQKHLGKRAFFIAVEAADGGGTLSIAEQGVPFAQPESLEEYQKLVAGLAGDTYFGAVVVDNFSDLIQRFIKPMALKLPAKMAGPARSKGVPCPDDYQVMGEFGRVEMNKLVNLTTHKDLAIRKHLVVTALEKEILDDDWKVRAIKADLPGQLKDAVSAMFQTVGRLKIASRVVPNPAKPGQNIRVQDYIYDTANDGVSDVGDRTHVFPPQAPADFVEIWEKWWMPRIEGR